MIESTGVKAITVHCRYRDQRSTTPARWDEFKEAISVVKSIPVAVNGDVFCYKDIESIKEKTSMALRMETKVLWVCLHGSPFQMPIRS